MVMSALRRRWIFARLIVGAIRAGYVRPTAALRLWRSAEFTED